MPLYLYFCENCDLKFEKLNKLENRELPSSCPVCGKLSNRTYSGSTFGISSKLDPKKDTIYSPKEIDKVIGESAAKKWEGYNGRWKGVYDKRRSKRWAGKEPQIIDIPKEGDGSYRPLLHLGDKKQRKLRKEYSEAFQEHKKELKKKGLSQFDGPGAIAE